MADINSTVRFLRSKSKYLLSYSCWWTLYCIALLTPIFLQMPDSPKLGLGFNRMSVLSGAIISILVAIPNKPVMAAHSNKALIIAISCIEIGLVASLQSFTLVGGFLLGVGISILQILWGVLFFSKLSMDDIYLATVLPIVLGSVLAFTVIVFGSAISTIVAFILPVGMAVGIFTAKTPTVGRNNAPTTRRNPNQKAIACPIILTTSFGFAFGVFRTILLPELSYFEISAFGATVLSCCMAGILVLAISLRLSQSTRVPSALGMTLFAVTTAVFILSLLESEGKTVAQAIITGGFRCVDVITWIMLLLSINGNSTLTSIRAFALWRGLGCLGCFLGYLAGDAVTTCGIPDSIGLVPPSIFLLLLLMAATAISVQFLRQSSVEDHATELSVDNTMLYDSISSKYCLSKREAQVFELLCAGRSVPYIADKLVIAPSTATTHVQRIYRKLDVHSKQELIDLVERNRSELAK